MTDHNFLTGDVVKLKSGGPDMTVSGASRAFPQSGLVVNWIAKDVLQRAEFFHHMLVKKTPETKEN